MRLGPRTVHVLALLALIDGKHGDGAVGVVGTGELHHLAAGAVGPEAVVGLHVAAVADGLGQSGIGRDFLGLGRRRRGQDTATAERRGPGAIVGFLILPLRRDLEDVAGLFVGASDLVVALAAGRRSHPAGVGDLARPAGGRRERPHQREEPVLRQVGRAIADLQVQAIEGGQFLRGAGAGILQHEGAPVGAADLILVHLAVGRGAHISPLIDHAVRSARLGDQGLNPRQRFGVLGQQAVDGVFVRLAGNRLVDGHRQAVECIRGAIGWRHDDVAKALLAGELVDLGGVFLAVGVFRLALAGVVGVDRRAADARLLDQARGIGHALLMTLGVADGRGRSRLGGERRGRQKNRCAHGGGKSYGEGSHCPSSPGVVS